LKVEERMGMIPNEIRLGLRQMRKAPAFTVIAVLTLTCITTVSMPQLFNHCAISSRAAVQDPNSRTGRASRPGIKAKSANYCHGFGIEIL
jgi:hypothetical protein